MIAACAAAVPFLFSPVRGLAASVERLGSIPCPARRVQVNVDHGRVTLISNAAEEAPRC